MKYFSGIFKNTSIMLFVNGIRALTSFVIVIFTARMLDATGLGKYSFIISFLVIFQTIAVLGIQPLIIREVSKNKNRAGKYLMNASLLGSFSSMIMIILIYLITWLANYSSDISTSILIIGLSLIPFTLNNIFESIFIGVNKNKYVLFGIFISNSIKITISMAVLYMGYGIVGLAAVFVLTSFIQFFINTFYMFRKITKPVFKVDWKAFQDLCKLVPTFAGLSITQAVSANIIILLLINIKGPEEVGFYSAAFRLMFVFNLILQSFRFAIQPQLAAMFKESKENFQELSKKCIKYVCTLTIPTAVLFSFMADKIIVIIFSKGFVSSVPVFQIIIWALIPYGIAVVLASILLVSNNQKVDLKNNIISMCINACLGVILVSLYGYIGAAVNYVIYMIFFAIIHYFSVIRRLFPMRLDKILYKVIGSSVIMGLFCLLLSRMNLLLLVFLSLVVFYPR